MTFQGVVGPTWRESTAWWPPEPTPPAGAPNVVLIVLDDVGFAQLGCYGSDIATPNIDALATGGVRLSNFHTTALCSPTRACLLTGRNHHSNGMGRIADLAVGFPGYTGRIPRENLLLSEMLAAHGYLPVAVGKWHLTPEDETHMAAPRDTWPCGRGFQRWYGFHGGETNQFVPTLFRDNHSVRPPDRADYHLTSDLADTAIRYLGELRSASEQPFLLYFATGACHSPHQPPLAWRDHYAGRFAAGWDAWRESTFARQLSDGLLPATTKLSPRPKWVPPWSDLDPADQEVAARFMECFAGFMSDADEQIGRVLAFVKTMGEWDNTIVVLISDNGASAEGGERGSINDARLWNGDPAGRKELRNRVDELGTARAHNNYPWGWTMAGNTPFRRWKREVHQGGVCDPCIVHWPRGVASAGAIRHQFAHAIDVAPTLLELIGVPIPAEIEGTSFAYALDRADAPERHTTQYFEMLGSRGIYDNGWKAVTFKPLGHMYDDGLDPNAPFEDDRWELYHVANDRSETDDLAGVHPERLEELKDKWWQEARKYQVLPLDNRPLAALENPRRPIDGVRRQVLWPGGSVIPETAAIRTHNRAHTIAATVIEPGEGVIVAMGNALGGWSLHVEHGCLRYVHNYAGKETSAITSPPLERYRTLGLVFETAGDLRGTAHLIVDGAVVASGAVTRTTPARYSITGGGLTCGWEQGPSVGTTYDAPFRFTGRIDRVIIDATAGVTDPLAAFEAIMSEQ